MNMGNLNPLLLLLIAVQGIWVRLKTPRLPEAAGSNEGITPGIHPALELIVIGESTVAGVGAPSHDLALSGQIAKALSNRTGRAVRWKAFGKSGATAESARLELAPGISPGRADLVVIALGVNDSLKRRSPSRWSADVEQLILSIRNRVGPARVVLAGVPPLDSFPSFPSSLAKFMGNSSAVLENELKKLAADLSDVVHAPMTEKLSPQHFGEDRFHPNVKGYAVWAEHLCYFALSEVSDSANQGVV